MKNIILSFVSIFVLSACGNAYKKHEATFNERMLDVQKARLQNGEDIYAESEGDITSDPVQSSLWARSAGSPYIIRNQKAAKVGDLLTILIDEQATASTSANTKAERQSDIGLSGSLSVGQGSLEQLATASANPSLQNDYEGKGTTDRSGKFETTVQAVVENVLPNGTLFVRGRKIIAINNEDQEVEISGFVRPDDIRIGNTVASTVMADAEIRYIGRGIIGDKQQGGWGARVIDWVWPF